MRKSQRMWALLSCSTMAFMLQACSSQQNIKQDAVSASNQTPQQVQTQAKAATEFDAKEKASRLASAKQLFITKNYDAAFEALQPLAKAGDADAQYGLGYLYYYGKGTETNHDEGVRWISSAAEQGFANAIKALEILDIDVPKIVKKPSKPNKAIASEATAKRATTVAKASAKETFKGRRSEQRQAANDDKLVKPIINTIRQARTDVVQKTPQVASLNGGTYGPTNKLDTLWSIAKNARSDRSISIHQMMTAIMKLNPHAFTAQDDVHSLKRNVTLQIPTEDEARDILKNGNDELAMNVF